MIEITLDKKQRFLFKHDFVRQFKPIDEVRDKEINALAAVAAEEFEKLFPDIAKAIKEAKENRTPLFIDRLPLGYPASTLESTSFPTAPLCHEREIKEQYPKLSKNKHTLQADKILALAILYLMGLNPVLEDNTEKTSRFINNKSGDADGSHTHRCWSIVIGIMGIDKVETHLGKPYNRGFVLGRGSVLLIPTEVDHSVDGFITEKLPGTSKEWPRRISLACFPNDNPEPAPSPEELEGAREMFLQSIVRGNFSNR